MELKTNELRVDEYMTPDPITVVPEIPFLDAVTIMFKKGIGNLIVEKSRDVTGLLTERQIIQYLAQEKEISNKPMNTIATNFFTKIPPKTTLYDAAKQMISKKSRLLVFDNEKLVGIITTSDILRGFRKSGKNPPLDNVLRTKITRSSYDDSLFNVIKLMHEKRIGSVIITKDDVPYGIFTERDLLAYILAIEADLEEKVGRYCSSPLVTAKIGIGGNDAANIMVSKRIKRLPLTKEGNMIAMVTARDVASSFVT